MADYSQFAALDIRVGTVLQAEHFSKARTPAYQLEIDFGSLGIKKSSAQITHHYSPKNLIGRQVIAIINFPVKQIANFFSECLVLGIYDAQNEVVLLAPDKPVENGNKIG